MNYLQGYSQGGVLSAIIVGIMNDKDNCLKLDNVKIDKDALKFVWINCGFIGRAKNVKPLFFDKDENKKKFENIKCLICCSKDDKYVEMQKTLDVAQLFVDPVIIEYDGYKIKTESDINTKYAELKVLFDELSKASEDKSIDVIDEKMKSVNDAIKFIKPELRSGGHFVPDDADTILKYKDFFKQFL